MSTATFKELVERKRKNTQQTPDLHAIKGGRQSVADNNTTLGLLLQEMALIDPDFNVNVLKSLEVLATYHSDFSYAVDNIKQLGNTSWNVYFDDTIPDELQKEMMLRIKAQSKQWYTYSGGLTSMIGDLLAQIAIFGALSAENAILEDLSGVKKTILVNPKNIRFKYNAEKDIYQPYQLISNRISQTLDGTSIELNTNTYKYIALGRFTEKPYGIPPFLSALENIAIDRDMSANFKYVIKKLGTLGFLEVLVNGPKPLPNEEATTYYARTADYLNRVIPEIDKGLARGFVAGFKDVHEFKMHNLTGNVQGAKDLSEINDTKTMAGLKQDPLMFGRNFSTTETLGRVILAKMTTQVAGYQKIVASYLESVFLTDLQLAGYPITNLDVVFDPPMVGDKLREEQTFKERLANLDTLLNKGVIDIFQYAQEAGYETPADPEKHKINPFTMEEEEGEPEKKKKTEDKEDVTDTGDATDPKSTEANKKLEEAVQALSKGVKEFDYQREEFPDNASCCSNHTHTHSFSVSPEAEKFIEQYIQAISGNYSKATISVARKVASKLLSMSGTATLQEVQEAVLYEVYTNWGGAFKAKNIPYIRKFVESAYTFFRRDASPFGDIDIDLPRGTFDLVDLRAVEFFKKSDDLYLGKFITDKDTRRAITEYIKEQYLNGDLPIGNDREALEKFKKHFSGVLQGEDWKIRRVLDTTINKLRSTAVVKYMEEAQVQYYEIRGVVDRLQCEYCASMQGKRFSVAKAIKHVEGFVNSDPEYLSDYSPFVTGLFKDAEVVKTMSGEELQDKGLGITPFHCNCRDTLVAVL